MSRAGQTHYPKCTACGSTKGFFTDVHYRGIRHYDWEGNLLSDPVPVGNLVFREENRRCAHCKFNVRVPWKAPKK